MIKSLISSAHHYYVIFFEAERFKTINEILSVFPGKKKSKEISYKSRKYLHAQVLIEKRYGSENAISGNQYINSEEQISYWYDFYIGKMEVDERRVFFISFPYFKMRKFLERVFKDKNITPRFYKPQLVRVLEYMHGEKRSAVYDTKEGFTAEIIKYSASISDFENKSRMSLIGDNPLESRAYKILNSDSQLTVVTTSLKLRCTKLGLGDLEMSFDKLGNYRYWIKRNAEESATPIVPYAFDFFKKLDAFEINEYIGNQTLLENE